MITFKDSKLRLKVLKREVNSSQTQLYVIALLVTILAVSVRWLFNPLLGSSLALVTIYGAIAFTSWLGGWKPSLVPTILGYVLCHFLFIQPQYEFLFNRTQIVGFTLYCITCSIIIILGEISRMNERRLILKEKELRNTLDSITDAFFSLDNEWRFTYFNRAASKEIGRNVETILNKVIWTEFASIVGTEIEVLYRKVMSDQTSGSITSFYAPYSKWYEIRAYPSDNGLSVYFRDVTEKIIAEQRLNQQSAELAEMDRRKNEFLATLAHELRNPLAPIRNTLSILELKSTDPHIDKARQVIDRQVSQMVRLIDDLMDVSRITHGKLEIKRSYIILADVIKTAVESSLPFMKAAGLKLSVSLPPDSIKLNADATRLTQVFLNLLNNAAKFTNPGGQVNILSELVRNNDDQEMIAIRISDTGIGIPSEDQSKIFEGFTQLPSSLKRSHGGLGIGLMLVKQIVEMHYGSVGVYSEGPNMGTTFTVLLPIFNIDSIVDQHIPLQIGHDKRVKSLRILVVDDNQDAAISLASFFEILGHQIMMVHDGTSAIETAESFQPNVIILDIGMPDINGYEVASYIRKQSWGEAIKLLAVTGWGQEDARSKSSLAGFDSHIVKPVDPNWLHRLISDIDFVESRQE
jgi:signal transduction histidine kinase/CheY-like chemotaxis protein